jgi:hypothetical protein
MPHIAPTEVAVVAAAVVLFYFVPVAVAWRDEARRRKLLRQEAAACASARLSEIGRDTTVAPLAEALPPEPGAAAADSELPGKLDSSANVLGAAPVAETALPGEEPVTVQVLQTAQVDRAADLAPTIPEPSVACAALEVQPRATPGRHRFRLQDLHRTQLPDWPPAVVRHDAERNRMWQEAERIAEEYRDRIDAATISSPYPARATCLGAAEVDGPVVRLRYLLFPSVWPVSENQAVAQAVFEVDRARAEIHGWVDALRASELSEDNRREIQQSGGETGCC